MQILTRLTAMVIILLSMATYPAASASGGSVERIDIDLFDLTAKKAPRRAATDLYCALVKVVKPGDTLTFEGDIVGDVCSDGTEYSVYIRPTARTLTVIGSDGARTVIDFAAYDLLPLIQNAVYNVILTTDTPERLSVDERVRRFTPKRLSQQQEKELESLGRKYLDGYDKPRPRDTNPDYAPGEGEYNLRVAAEYGKSSTAPYLLGRYYHFRRKFERAFEFMFTSYSRDNNRAAARELALMYESGLGCPRDTAEAISLWRELFWNTTDRDQQKQDEHSFRRLKSSPYTIADFNNPELHEFVRLSIAKASASATVPHILVNDAEQLVKNTDTCIISHTTHPLRYALLCEAARHGSLQAAESLIEIFWQKNDLLRPWLNEVNVMYPFPLPDEETMRKTVIAILEQEVADGNSEATAFQERMRKEQRYYLND